MCRAATPLTRRKWPTQEPTPKGETGEAELSPTVRTNESLIPEPQGDTFATPGPDARRIDNQRRQRRSLGYRRRAEPPSPASHIASRGPEFPVCARKGRRYPSLNRTRALNSHEPSTPCGGLIQAADLAHKQKIDRHEPPATPSHQPANMSKK